MNSILSMHIMSVHNVSTKLWRNAVEYNVTNPSIEQNISLAPEPRDTVNSTVDPVSLHVETNDEVGAYNINNDEGLTELPFNSDKIGMWVKVSYEEEIFIGKVTNLCDQNGCEVRCLTLPYVVAGSDSELERESDKCYYMKVYSTNVKPQNVKVGRKLVWKYTVE